VPGPIGRSEIPIAELDEVIKHYGITFRPGDILLVRSGFVRWHDNASDEERKQGTQTNKSGFIGVEGKKAAVPWFWNKKLAAVGGDTIAFEAWPPNDEVILHEYFLAHWGMPIGEMWNLEPLSQACAEANQYTFFLSSHPLYVPGGVGSPPNAIAIL